MALCACHLLQFVDEKVQWMHIDMAGPVWNDKKRAATGFGVSTLVEWVLKNSSWTATNSYAFRFPSWDRWMEVYHVFFSFVLLPFYSCHLQTASKADGTFGIPCDTVCDRISRRAGTPCVSWVTSVLGSCPWKRRRSRAVLPPPCSILRLVK